MFDCPRCADAAEEGFRFCPVCRSDLKARSQQERRRYRVGVGLYTHRHLLFIAAFTILNYLLTALGLIAAAIYLFLLVVGELQDEAWFYLPFSLVAPLFHYGLALIGRYVHTQISQHLNNLQTWLEHPATPVSESVATGS